MKKLLALSLVALMAGTASAQLEEVFGMGIFFSDSEFVDAQTNKVTTAAPFDAYIVLLTGPGSQLQSVGAYECSLAFSDPTVFLLSVTGPNGWTNVGSSTTNQVVGYSTPVPVEGGAAVLAFISMLYSGADAVDIFMGPSEPSSAAYAGPVIADGSNVEFLYTCFLTSGESGAGSVDDTTGGLVATLNGDGVVATESHSLSSIKALFD